MSTIFKLHTGGPAVDDWGNTVNYPYDSTALATIPDPNGAKASHEITSIPSPFARIDLVKSAFGHVNTLGLNGNTIFHKMVSDTLDVAEIFFNIGKYTNKVEIIRWNPTEGINALKASPNAGSKYLGDALEKYMQSAPAGSNFNLLQDIYLLNYRHGLDTLNIIGATSPSTLFFCSANNLTKVVHRDGLTEDQKIYFGNGAQPFTGTFRPLDQRDPEFVEYMFALKNSIPNFASPFPEVFQYIQHTRARIASTNPTRAIHLDTVQLATLNLNAINVADGAAIFGAEVLGHQLYSKSTAFKAASCEFKIAATRPIVGITPLALPTQSGNIYASLQYGGGIWGDTNKAPFIDPQGNINSRTLPANGSTYPYLTVSDFLEDRIIRVPHTLNKEHYFDGNLTGNDEGEAYLLPLKPLFFDYFTADDLQAKKMPDGKPMIEMNVLAGGSVKVTLRIPIAANDGHKKYVEYTRIYEPNTDPQIGANSNIGAITDLDFTGFVMPMVKFATPAEAIYNITCLQTKSKEITFSFFNEEGNVMPDSDVCRNPESGIDCEEDNYLIKGSNFEHIRVTKAASGYSGMLLPKFKKQNPTKTFEFAVDLGTSNTHIEYRDSIDTTIRAFTIDAADNQLHPMLMDAEMRTEQEVLEKDCIPQEIGTGDFQFPTRTVLSFANNVDWVHTENPYGRVNIPFYFDKRKPLDHNTTKTNLKWLDDATGQAQLTAYIRCLMLILRNKVVLNGGELQRTKITWFYPISMEAWRKAEISVVWADAYQEYFGGPIGNIRDITESAAPIEHWFGRIANANRMVNIDIGGGTTDIAFASGGTVGQVTSFRFAADSLFSNTLADGDTTNGIIDYYFPNILNVLHSVKADELFKIGEKLDNNHSNPADKASFLFGLKNSTEIKGKKVELNKVDFNRMLSQDREFKIVFILFYTSIIYHVAQIAKSRGDIQPPNVITFSGNGSKVLNIITSDTKILVNYTKAIFNQLGLEYGAGQQLEIMGLDGSTTAKTATCKGGITIGAGAAMGTPIIFRSDNEGVVDTRLKYKHVQQEIDGLPNPDFNQEYMQSVEKSVKDFFKFALETMPNPTVFNFKDNFKVDPTSIQTAKNISSKDISNYLKRGISNLTRNKEEMLQSQIEETFFFYPIKGVLNDLSTAIYNNKAAAAGNAAGEA